QIDFVLTNGCKGDKKLSRPRFTDVIGARTDHRQPGLGRTLLYFCIVKTDVEADKQVESGTFFVICNGGIEVLRQCVNQLLPASFVDATHFSNMSFQVPVTDELGENAMLRNREVALREHLCPREHVHHMRWQHHAADRADWIQYLPKAVKIDNRASFVQHLQRRHWLAAVTKIAIEGIFDDERASLLRPLQKLLPSLQRHYHA